MAILMPFGSWPYLVIQGGLEVLRRVPVSERVRKTAPFLRERFSMFLIEAPVLSTSPNVILLAKSFKH
jgi:hypothetical protein